MDKQPAYTLEIDKYYFNEKNNRVVKIIKKGYNENGMGWGLGESILDDFGVFPIKIIDRRDRGAKYYLMSEEDLEKYWPQIIGNENA